MSTRRYRKREQMMRMFLWLACGLVMSSGVSALCVGQSDAVAGEMVVTLVGTGGPELTADRQGESTLVEVGGQKLLFDAGRGTLDGLYQSRVLPQSVTRVFLTHLHSDHISGLPDLWITPWFLLDRKTHLEVWGPVGTQSMIDGMRQMYGHDLEHRVHGSYTREDLDIKVHEITAGVVYDVDGVRVTAVSVEHTDGNPAFGYRVEGAGRAVFLTGDCTFGEELVKSGRGADVVVTNVLVAKDETTPWLKPVFAKLMRPEQGARLFEATKPRLAVYSHIGKKGVPGAMGDDVIAARTRKAGYAGRLLVGKDHTRIVIGKTIEVKEIRGRLPELDGPGAKF